MGSVWLSRNAGKRKKISLDDSKLPKTMELWFFAIKRRKEKGGRKGKLIISHLWNSLDIQTWHCHNYTFSSKTWKRKKIKTLNHYLTKFQFTRLGQDGPGKAQTRNLVHFHDSGTEVISPVNSCRLGKMHSSEATHRYIQNGSNAGIPVWSLGFPWADTPTSILSKCCRRAWAGAGSLPGLLSGRTLWWAHRGPWQQWAEEWP